MTELAICLPKPGACGFFKLEAIRPDGRVRPLTGWFPNLITDVGLNRIGTGSYLSACHVGSNNTAPTVNDTILTGFIAGSSTVTSTSSGAQSSEPYYGWKNRTYRFAVGIATGNISEVGIATSRNNGGTTIMFSRALVLDELGDPTTVTVLADEVLDVTYQLRLYPPLTDTLQTVNITGSGSHDVITRARAVTSSGWGGYLGETANISPSAPSPIQVYNGDIGAITGGPSGFSRQANPYNLAYGNNDLYRDGGVSFGLDAGNVGGIRSASWTTSIGLYQTQWDPVIPKDNTNTLSLIFRYAWSRHTP